MAITSLRITDFRNLASVELSPCSRGLNIFYGDNGSINGYTEPLYSGESKKEILEDLQMMIEDCKKTRLLDEKTIKIRKGKWL